MAIKKKLIIDTDPGVDDAMAILLAFVSPEVEVVGLTTVFGNVRTPMATSNTLHLCELAGKFDLPVAQGELKTLKGVEKVRIADFVHGSDGLGNTFPPTPQGSALPCTAAEFLVKMVKESPGEITLLALGPLTNVAKAIELDSNFVHNVAEIVILGGAFFTNGNVNPAAEANLFGDPDAADLVFTSGARIATIGINVTHQIILTEDDLDDLSKSEGRFGAYLARACMFYLEYHKKAYNMSAVYLHDPAALVAVFCPELFTYVEGVVRVQVEGITKGIALLSATSKEWAASTQWSGLPPVRVATTVNARAVSSLVKERLMAA